MKEYATIEKVVLQRKQFYLEQAIDERLLQTMKVDEYRDIFGNDMIIKSFRTFIAGETLKRLTVTYPRSWWDGFKKDLFPAWLLKRYPAKMTATQLEADALYPNVSLPEDQFLIVMHRTSHDFSIPEEE